MMKNERIGFVLFLLMMWGVLMSSSCNNNDEPKPDNGKVKFIFEHKIDSRAIVYDTMQYINAAGNPYLVSEIQYFVSDFRLWKNGQSVLLDQWEDIHYVDTDIPASWIYSPADDIPTGEYDSITFVFGITGEKNQSFMFVNPPESFMFWPEYLGGGYHYMKLNGKWKTGDNTVKPFNFHLGIGQLYNEQGEITGFVQNWFSVKLPGSAFTINNNQTKQATITMNVEQWFKDPNVWDFNYWGGDIMEKQPAMHAAVENGHNVFTVFIK